MSESEVLEAAYDADFDQSPLSTYSIGRASPYLSNAEDSLTSDQDASPVFFAQPSPRSDTVLSPPLGDTLEAFRHYFQNSVSPGSSTGDDHLSGEPGEHPGHRWRFRSRALSSLAKYSTSNSSPSLSISSPAQGLSASERDALELSPYPTNPNDLQSPWVLKIPSDTQMGGFELDPWFATHQPGLAPPSDPLGALPSLGLVPPTPVSPGNPAKLGFQEILARRRAESIAPRFSAYRLSDNSGGSQVRSPLAPDTQQTWSTIIPQPPVPPVPSLSDYNPFTRIGGPRPAIAATPSVTSNLGVYTTRSPSNGGPLSPSILPSPTQRPDSAANSKLNLEDINLGNLGDRDLDLNLGASGPLWDNHRGRNRGGHSEPIMGGSRRATQANFKCPVPGCGSTFTRHFNLRGHIRSHNEERPFKCKWPGCDQSFARQHDCKKHEAVHLNIRPYTCEGCQKTFARMDSLNRHLRSEGGTECLRVQSEITDQEASAAAHGPEQHESAEPEGEVRTPAMQGTKRPLENVEEQDNGEGRGEPKRGKIIHRDYADVVPIHVESAPHTEHSVDEEMRDTETGDLINGTLCTVTIQSGQITCEEMFRHLVAHGCLDLSSDVDPEGYSSGLIQGGAFGDIWKGKLRDGTEVAIKVWRFASLLHNGSKSMKRAMREIYYWSKAKHEYVQELMGVIMFQGRLGMVSLWMDNGNLREYICKNPNVDRYQLCFQVATGIAYLHSQEMVHGDLKGTNILVSREGVAKLSDFDHSIMSECSIAFSETSKLGGGTTRWMAPELILDDDCNRSAYTDVYALGMTMLEIITGASPYSPQCKDDVNVIKAIMKKKLPVRPMVHLGDNLRGNRMWELLLRCWDYDPLARPKAAEVVESLQGIITLSTTSGPV